jgi:hypothetical protein
MNFHSSHCLDRIVDQYYQLASVNLNLLPAIQAEFSDLSSIEKQELLMNALRYNEEQFFSSDVLATEQYLPPVKYRKIALKSLRSLMESSSHEEIEFSDCFLEEYLSLMKNPSSEDEENSGWVSYSTPFIYPARIPFFVQRSHNLVGMKVWNAGLFLIEVFHALLQLSIRHFDDPMKVLKLWFGPNKKSFLELGSGVGMTGIVVERGLFLPILSSLLSTITHEENQLPGPPFSCHLPEMILSDYCEEITGAIDSNIQLSRTLRCVPVAPIHIEVTNNRRLNLFVGEKEKESEKQLEGHSLDGSLKNNKKEEQIINGFHNNNNTASNENHKNYEDLFQEQLKTIRDENKIKSLVLDWREYDPELIRNQPIHCMFAADCTYSEDLNLSLMSVFEDYLLNNILNQRDSVSSTRSSADSASWYLPINLIAAETPFVLIACTIRNRDTFRHFLSLLAENPRITSIDLTTDTRTLLREFPYFPPFYYESSSSTDIQLICLLKKNIL